MASRPLTLRVGIKVKFFGSGQNNNGMGKYLVPSPRFGLDGFLIDEDATVTHVSETRLEESLLCHVQRPLDCPRAETTVMSPIAPAPSTATVTSPVTPNVVLRSTKKRKATNAASEVQHVAVNA